MSQTSCELWVFFLLKLWQVERSTSREVVSFFVLNLRLQCFWSWGLWASQWHIIFICPKCTALKRGIPFKMKMCPNFKIFFFYSVHPSLLSDCKFIVGSTFQELNNYWEVHTFLAVKTLSLSSFGLRVPLCPWARFNAKGLASDMRKKGSEGRKLEAALRMSRSFVWCWDCVFKLLPILSLFSHFLSFICASTFSPTNPLNLACFHYWVARSYLYVTYYSF